MKFKVSDDFLQMRLNSLKRFKTKQELNALLVSDDDPVETLLAELTDIVPINEAEAYAFLLKLREISGGEDIEFIITCPNCTTMNNPRLPIEVCFVFDDYIWNDQVLPKGMFTSPDSIINSTELDNISLRDYNKLTEILYEQADNMLKLTHKTPCRKCRQHLDIFVDPRKVFSKTNLSGIYQDYINISMFSHNGKLDIDELYPFEREIFQSLIEEKMKPDDK
jgi:hypothetical protein